MSPAEARAVSVQGKADAEAEDLARMRKDIALAAKMGQTRIKFDTCLIALGCPLPSTLTTLANEGYKITRDSGCIPMAWWSWDDTIISWAAEPEEKKPEA